MALDDDAAVPPAAALVRDFVNSYEPQVDEESWGDPGRLGAWFQTRGIAAEAVDERDLVLAVRLREGLRELLLSHAGHDADEAALRDLDDALADIPVRLSTGGAAGTVRWVPAGDAASAPFAALVDAIERSRVEGSWERLKVCARDTCRWAFYDASRNRAGRWCSMSGCGNWAKNRRRPDRVEVG